MGYSFGHEAAHSEMDPGLGGGREVFPVLGEAAGAHEPRKGALDDPALGKSRDPAGISGGGWLAGTQAHRRGRFTIIRVQPRSAESQEARP